jgi:hypothetical protein
MNYAHVAFTAASSASWRVLDPRPLTAFCRPPDRQANPGNPEVTDVLAAAIAKQQGRAKVLARKGQQEETAAAFRREEEAVISRLQVELQALRATDPGMSLLDAVEYTTPDPDRRIALYGCCSNEDRSVNGRNQDDPRLFKVASLVASDTAFLKRRALAEGFQISMKRWPWLEEGSGRVWLRSASRHLSGARLRGQTLFGPPANTGSDSLARSTGRS